MTHGIVSALNRHNVGVIGREGYENFIQVDAPINPGNSGGPLVNIRGEVVGINTAIASRSGGFQGIGLAIPANQVQIVYQSLKERGKVVRGFVGVGIAEVAEVRDEATALGYTGNTGVLVQETYPNMPAWGKLIEGDIITKVNDKPVTNTQELRNEIAAAAPGSEMKLYVFRDGKNQDVSLTVGEQPEDITQTMLSQRDGRPRTPAPAPAPAAVEQLGMRLEPLTPDTKRQLGVSHLTGGALIATITPNSPADKAGLVPGIVITQVNRKPVNDPQDVADVLSKADPDANVLLYINTREGARFMVVKVK
jgi:serine protease Do